MPPYGVIRPQCVKQRPNGACVGAYSWVDYQWYGRNIVYLVVNGTFIILSDTMVQNIFCKTGEIPHTVWEMFLYIQNYIITVMMWMIACCALNAFCVADQICNANCRLKCILFPRRFHILKERGNYICSVDCWGLAKLPPNLEQGWVITFHFVYGDCQ